MSDYAELRAKADACVEFDCVWHEPATVIYVDPSLGPWSQTDSDFIVACSPQTVLALLDELDRLREARA